MIRELITKVSPRLTTYFIILIIFFSMSISADDYDHDKARKLVQSGDILPLETILENLKKRSSGHILEVEMERKKGRFIYEIELVDDQGVVKEFVFDASNGKLLKEKVED
tara:strand:- start:648 stop:977 length:330 start_codon:yes stop_codon:yes gene_type:complete